MPKKGDKKKGKGKAQSADEGPGDTKPEILKVDMPADMQKDALDCAQVAFMRFNHEKDIAAFIKKEFDRKYDRTWQCIVGSDFGTVVSYQCRSYIYFLMNRLWVLLFKTEKS